MIWTRNKKIDEFRELKFPTVCRMNMIEVYDRYFSHIQHENVLIASRLNSFLAISTLMFSGVTLLIYMYHDPGLPELLKTGQSEGLIKHMINAPAVGEKLIYQEILIQRVVRIISGLGIIVSIIATISLAAAVKASHKLNEEYLNYFCAYVVSDKDESERLKRFHEFPQIAGAGSKNIATMGDSMPVFVGLFSGFIWLIILITGVEPFQIPKYEEFLNLFSGDSAIQVMMYGYLAAVFAATVGTVLIVRRKKVKQSVVLPELVKYLSKEEQIGKKQSAPENVEQVVGNSQNQRKE